MMNQKNNNEYNKLNDDEKKTYDSVMKNFPKTSHMKAMDVAIQGGIKFDFIYK